MTKIFEYSNIFVTLWYGAAERVQFAEALPVKHYNQAQFVKLHLLLYLQMHLICPIANFLVIITSNLGQASIFFMILVDTNQT